MTCPQLLRRKYTCFEVADGDAAPPALPPMPSPIADDELQMHGDLRLVIGKAQTICAKWLIKVSVNEWATPTLQEIDALQITAADVMSRIDALENELSTGDIPSNLQLAYAISNELMGLLQQNQRQAQLHVEPHD